MIASRKASGARKFRAINFEIGCQESNILWHPSLEECELGGCHFCTEGKGGGRCDARTGQEYFKKKLERMGIEGPWAFTNWD